MSKEPPRQFRVTSVRRSTQMPDAMQQPPEGLTPEEQIAWAESLPNAASGAYTQEMTEAYTRAQFEPQMPDAGKDAEAWDFEVINGIELAVKGDDLETAAVTGLRGLIGVVNALQQQLAEARQELETLKSDLGLDDVFTANAELFQRAINAEQERDRYKAALERITEMSGSYAIPKGDNIARHPAGFVVIYEAAYSALAPDAGS